MIQQKLWPAVTLPKSTATTGLYRSRLLNEVVSMFGSVLLLSRRWIVVFGAKKEPSHTSLIVVIWVGGGCGGSIARRYLG